VGGELILTRREAMTLEARKRPATEGPAPSKLHYESGPGPGEGCATGTG